jgi:hypothetical protein
MQAKFLEIVNNHNSEVFIKNFVDHMPVRCSIAIALKLPARTKSYCSDLDSVEFHYRRYVSGQYPTISKVNAEIRTYLSNGHYASGVMEVIVDLEEIILAAEFYELMPRLKSSRLKIEKLIKDFYVHPSSRK